MPANTNNTQSYLARELVSGTLDLAYAAAIVTVLASTAYFLPVVFGQELFDQFWRSVPLEWRPYIPNDWVSLGVIATFSVFLLAAGFSSRDMWAVTKRAGYAVFSVAVILAAAIVGILVREWVLCSSLELLATLLLALALALAALWLFGRLAQVRIVPRLSERTRVVLAGAVTAFVIAFTLISFLVPAWNGLVPPWLELTPDARSATVSAERVEVPAAEPSKPDPDKLFDDLSGRLDILFGLIGAALATAATVYVVQQIPELDQIVRYIGLSSAQVEAAHRMRQPLSDLFSQIKSLDFKFKREVIITESSFGPELPLETRSGGARVKIIAPRRGGSPDSITFDAIKEHLRQAQVEIRESIVFVYLDRRENEPLCYATGPEFWELMQPASGDDDRPASGRFRGEFSAAFFTALNSGDGDRIKDVVKRARRFVLNANPQDDVLLCDIILRDTMEFKDALTTMRRNGLRRALVCSTRVPHERAVIGVPHIAEYLWNDPTPAPAEA